MTPHLLSITFRITTDKGLKLELKKKNFFLHGRAVHVDCIGMRAISMGGILAHNIGCAIRHPNIILHNHRFHGNRCTIQVHTDGGLRAGARTPV